MSLHFTWCCLAFLPVIRARFHDADSHLTSRESVWRGKKMYAKLSNKTNMTK